MLTDVKTISANIWKWNFNDMTVPTLWRVSYTHLNFQVGAVPSPQTICQNNTPRNICHFRDIYQISVETPTLLLHSHHPPRSNPSPYASAKPGISDILMLCSYPPTYPLNEVLAVFRPWEAPSVIKSTPSMPHLEECLVLLCTWSCCPLAAAPARWFLHLTQLAHTFSERKFGLCQTGKQMFRLTHLIICGSFSKYVLFLVDLDESIFGFSFACQSTSFKCWKLSTEWWGSNSRVAIRAVPWTYSGGSHLHTLYVDYSQSFMMIEWSKMIIKRSRNRLWNMRVSHTEYT